MKNTIERLWNYGNIVKERNCEKQKRKRGYDDDDARRKGELERRAQVVHTWCTVVQEIRFLFIHIALSFTLGSGKEFSIQVTCRIQSLYLTQARYLSNVKFYVHVYMTRTEGGQSSEDTVKFEPSRKNARMIIVIVRMIP